MPIGALTTCILIIDDIRDRRFDAVKGKRTVAVRFGARWSRAEFFILLLLEMKFNYKARRLWPQCDFWRGTTRSFEHEPNVRNDSLSLSLRFGNDPHSPSSAVGIRQPPERVDLPRVPHHAQNATWVRLGCDFRQIRAGNRG